MQGGGLSKHAHLHNKAQVHGTAWHDMDGMVRACAERFLPGHKHGGRHGRVG